MNSFELLPFKVVLFYIFVIGLCVGSFLNVAILRGLSGENMVFERSKCPKCKKQLKWYMNIPLLSYIFLKGKCAYCSCKISFQYPLVEFLTGLCFVFSFLFFGISLKAVFVCIILSIFILLCATDFIEMVILDYHTYTLLAVGLLYSFLKLGDINIIQSVIGAVFGFLIFELLARIGCLIANHRIFGEGDSLIALGLGAIFGYKALVLVIFLSILIQSLCAFPILIKKAYCENKKKLSLSYVFVFISLFFVVFVNYFKLIQNDLIYLLCVILITGLLLWSLKNIVSEIKNKKSQNENEETKFYLMPFGPALIFASTICIFYLPQIKNCIFDFFL